MIREAALAIAFVAAGSVVDPHVAVVIWSDGYHEEINAVNRSQCEMIPADVAAGRWHPLGRDGTRIIGFACEHRSGFDPNWKTIKGSNR